MSLFHKNSRENVAWGAAITGLCFHLVAVFRVAIPRDAGGFMTIAAEMGSGGRLYVDMVERKPPLLMALLEWVFRLGSPTIWYARGTILILFLVSVYLLWHTCRTLQWKASWSALTVAVFIWLGPAFLTYATMTEMPVMLACALVLAILADEQRSRSIVWLAVSGLIIGIAATSKQTAVLFAPAVGLWLMLDAYHERRAVGTSIKMLAVFCMGVVFPLIGVTAYYAATGRLDMYVHATVTTNLVEYAAVPLRLWPRQIIRGQLLRGLVVWVPAAAVGGIAVWRYLRRSEDRFTALLALVIAFSFIASRKRTYEHYVQAYLPALVLLGVIGWQIGVAALKRSGRSNAMLVAAAVLLSLGTIRHYVLYTVPEMAAGTLLRQIQISDRIQSHLEPEEPIFFIAGEPQYYFLTRRYMHIPPVWVVADALSLAPPELLREKLLSTDHLRHIVVTEGMLNATQDIADKVRAQGELVFAEQVPGRESVEMYRLPDGWTSEW
jgi:hypothetical protein